MMVSPQKQGEEDYGLKVIYVGIKLITGTFAVNIFNLMVLKNHYRNKLFAFI